jgi:hypothetical protein
MQRSLSTPSSRGNKRVKRNNILALSIADMQSVASSSNTLDPLLPNAPSLDQELEEDEESQTDEFEQQSDVDDDQDGERYSETDDSNNDNDTEMEDNLAIVPVSLLKGDWVAVKVGGVTFIT